MSSYSCSLVSLLSRTIHNIRLLAYEAPCFTTKEERQRCLVKGFGCLVVRHTFTGKLDYRTKYRAVSPYIRVHEQYGGLIRRSPTQNARCWVWQEETVKYSTI